MTKSSFPETFKQVLLENISDEVNLGFLPEGDWIKLNKNTVGIYRTNYSADMLKELQELLSNQNIHPTDRLGLQSDAFALVIFFLNTYILMYL